MIKEKAFLKCSKTEKDSNDNIMIEIENDIGIVLTNILIMVGMEIWEIRT